MFNRRTKDKRSMLWFVGGAALGFGIYMTLRHPLKTAGTLGEGHLKLLGATKHTCAWPGGTLTYFKVGDGPEPLVLVHGFADAPQFWGATVAHLRERYTIVMPVLPGHAGTSTPSPLALGHFVQALDAAILHAFKGDRVHLAGFSLGGWVSTLFAAAASERLLSLSLINPAGMLTVKDASVLAPLKREEGKRALKGLLGPIATYAPDMMVDGYIEDWHARTDPAVVDLLLRAPKPADALANVNVRTQVIIGRRDKFIPPRSSQEFADGIPHASTELVPDGAHALHATHSRLLAALLARGPVARLSTD